MPGLGASLYDPRRRQPPNRPTGGGGGWGPNTNPFVTGLGAPQGVNEPNIAYGARSVLQSPFVFAQDVLKDIAKGAAYAFETPAQAAARLQQPAGGAGSSAFPNSYLDARWDALEQQLGGAEAPLLRAVRTLGERSNSDQVNARTGASTPYQITAKTRQGIIEKYGFDPWSSPENAVKGAAIVLRDHGGAANPQAAVGGYFGGARGAKNPFDMTVGDGNLKIGEYVNRVLGQNLVNPFDPTYLNAAGSALERGRQAALTPTSDTFQGEPMPVLPEPEPSPKTDFSAADAALQQLRPVEMTLKTQKDIHWKNFWGGLGQAMMQSPEGEGLGSFFLRLGGAALAAKGATGDEIQKRRDLYDAQMAKWQAAVYEHDFQKAQLMQRELMNDWEANQKYVAANYSAALTNWKGNVTPQITGDGSRIFFQRVNPTTGEINVSSVPIKPVIDADFAMKQANLLLQGFGEQNQANAQVAGVANSVQGQIVLGQAAQVLADSAASDSEKAAAAVMGPYGAVDYAVKTRQVPAIIGEKSYEQLNEEIITQLNGSGLTFGSKEFGEAYHQAMTGRLLGAALGDPATLDRLMQTIGPAANIYDMYERYQNRTERRTVKRGGVTEQVTYEGE